MRTMRTARAAVYEAPNTPFVLKEFPLRPAKRGEVVSLGLKSIVSGTLTTCLLGAIVGVLS